MAYSALEIAKFVINYEHEAGRQISNLRLQKLLYFVQAKVLVETGEPCFDDEIQAWDYGPVVPTVYHTYKVFGSWDINLNEEFIPVDEKSEEIIINMLDSCKDYPTYQLVDITHKQRPWIEARQRGVKSTITPDSIKEYFKAQENTNE